MIFSFPTLIKTNLLKKTNKIQIKFPFIKKIKNIFIFYFLNQKMSTIKINYRKTKRG